MESSTYPETNGLADNTRRNLIKRLAAIGITGPAALAALRFGDAHAEHTFLGESEFESGLSKIVASAQTKSLVGYKTFELNPLDSFHEQTSCS